MKSSAPAISSQAETDLRQRPGRFGLAVMTVLLLTMTACGGVSGQPRGDSGAVEARVTDYENMVKEYDRQNGPPDEGFWREVYKDSDY